MVEIGPKLVQAEIKEITDTTVRVDIPGRIGVITVPHRHVITNNKLKIGQKVEFYFSYLRALDE